MGGDKLKGWLRAMWQPATYFGLAMVAVVWAAVGYSVYVDGQRTAQEAIRESDNFAWIFEEYVVRTITSIDNKLLLLRRLYQLDPAHLDLRAWRDQFQSPNDPSIGIALIGADGWLIATSTGPVSAPVYLGDRDHFLVHHDSTRDDLFIGRPLEGRFSGQWLVRFTRRITASDGSFAGVITISIDNDYLGRLFKEVELGNNGFAGLVGLDGFLRARSGTAQAFMNRPADANLSDAPIFQHVKEAPSDTSWVRPSGLDHINRLIGYRTISGFPLFVMIGRAEDVIMAKSNRRAQFYYGAGMGITALILLALIVIAARERKLALATVSLERTNMCFNAALSHMAQGLAMFDTEQRLIVSNDRYARIYGFAPETLKPGVTLREIVERRIERGIYAGENPTEYMRERLAVPHDPLPQIQKLSDGRAILVTRQPMKNGGWVTTHEDVTERERAGGRIAEMARRDALTGLGNRLQLLEAIEIASARLRRLDEPFSILLLDLDRFKQVNDSLGHVVGDMLLQAVAKRLRAASRDVDTIVRLGGDEFAILQSVEGDQHDDAIAMANRLIETIGTPFDLDGHQVIIGTSIGIAMAPSDGADGDQLLKNADLALYRTKSEGRNGYHFFEIAMEIEARARHALEIDLRQAIARDQLEMHYQPVVSIATGEICGVEALIRWFHPRHGLITPDRFIPLAEETGLIVPLGYWILNRVCSDAVKWPSHIKVAINLSAAQFGKGNLVEVITDALAQSGLPPHRLELEITETVLLRKDESQLGVLHHLKSFGVSIVLDDFGTGYSSFSYLQMFPFDKIKIDRSFVQDLSSREDCAAIVCAIIGLARTLDIETTAEGVETREQLELLRAAGCGLAQGYLFGKPCANAELRLSGHPADAAVLTNSA
jgi:diguanylate cyclase (GGDEF)-like protein